MDHVLPQDMRSALDRDAARPRRDRAGLVAVSGEGAAAARHRVVELTDSGMVIRAEATPHLRGFVDILSGEERVARRLVVLSWARDGLAGYEFKRGGRAGPVPADYELPVHTGLIEGPRAL